MLTTVVWDIRRVTRGAYEVYREGVQMLPQSVGLGFAREFVGHCLNDGDSVQEVSQRGTAKASKKH